MVETVPCQWCGQPKQDNPGLCSACGRFPNISHTREEIPMEFDHADKLCPVCKMSVRYVITAHGSWWVHVFNGRPVFNGHDANTYAPDCLLTRDDVS